LKGVHNPVGPNGRLAIPFTRLANTLLTKPDKEVPNDEDGVAPLPDEEKARAAAVNEQDVPDSVTE
jgi:hypothetical protein